MTQLAAASETTTTETKGFDTFTGKLGGPPGASPSRSRGKPRDRPRRTALPHRADIEGLRAVAVLAVLAFHATVPGLAGGYIEIGIAQV